MMDYLLLSILPVVMLGACLGFFGGLFGIGGGIIAIPVLIMVYGMDQSTAQGTALVMMVPNLVIAMLRYVTRNPLQWGQALALAAIACATTWISAHFAQGMDQRVLRILFALFLLWLAWRMACLADDGDASVAPHSGRHQRFVPLVGLLGGSSMGLLGIGGGMVATPVLTGWFKLDQRMAQSLALALVAPSSVLALASYAQAGRVDWNHGLALGLGGLFTVSAGVTLAHEWPQLTLRRGFAVLLVATGLWLIIQPYVMG